MYLEKDGWSIVYDRAERPDGSLFFPSRLTPEFLEQQKKRLGTYIYTNQYLNIIIPEGMQTFKKEWLSYWRFIPEGCYTFAFIDPAISQEEGSDFTALVVVDVDASGRWYLKVAKRARLTVTEQVQLIFKVNRLFQPMAIGIEDVAYQKALIQLVASEMIERDDILPIKGIKRGNKIVEGKVQEVSKFARIRSLVPRFEWGQLLVAPGLHDFETEYLKFPKGLHDDILDALQSIDQIALAPAKEEEEKRDPVPSDAENYERWYRQQLAKKAEEEFKALSGL